MTSNMIALIGEQPIPNLLPILHQLPQAVLLVRTKFTELTSIRLKAVLKDRVTVEFVDIKDAYHIVEIYEQLSAKIEALHWSQQSLVFNITGGTKPMSVAAYQLAVDWQQPIQYLQSEQQQSRLRQYRLTNNQRYLENDETIGTVITIEDYLNAHLPGFKSEGFSTKGQELSDGGAFEETIFKTLKPNVDEIVAGVKPEGVKDQIEIDLVVRCGNQVGIIEAKTGANKQGLDQLAMAGGRAYLGIYTVRFLVVGRRLRSELRTLAAARNIHIIELPGYTYGRPLSRAEANQLINAVREKLGSGRK